MNERPPERMPWKRLSLAAVLLTLALAPGHFATPDAHVRLSQARNLVTNGSFAVPEGVGNPDHGNLAPGTNGKTYSTYNPGHIVLLAPLYALATQLPTPAGLHPHYLAELFGSFLGLLAHFLTALLFLGLLLKLGLDERWSLFITAVFAFATVALPEATNGFEHPFEALSIVAAFFFATPKEGDATETRPGLAGLALGLGILFRYSVGLALPGLLLLARNWRNRSRVLLGVAGPLGLTLLYNHYRFGSFFETGYSAAWGLAHGDAIGEFGLQLTNIPSHLTGLLASPGKGLIWFCPVLLLAVVCWHRFRKHRPKLTDGFALTSGLYLLFYAANFAWHGSVWSWGPRYIVPIVPIVVVAIAFLPRRRVWLGALAALTVVSLLIQAAGLIADHRRHLVAEYLEEPSGFEERILYEPSASPVLGQLESAAHVTTSTLTGGPYHPYISPGPWRSVARPVSSEMMLENSIDFNVINIWWLRLLYFPWSLTVRVLAVVVGLSSAVSATWLLLSSWKNASDA